MVNEKVTNLRVINFFSLFLLYHQHFWDLFWSFRCLSAIQMVFGRDQRPASLLMCSWVSSKKKLNRKCLWREINPIVQGSFHWHDVRPKLKKKWWGLYHEIVQRIQVVSTHKENFCVGCYCLSSPFFMCIQTPFFCSGFSKLRLGAVLLFFWCIIGCW